MGPHRNRAQISLKISVNSSFRTFGKLPKMSFILLRLVFFLLRRAVLQTCNLCVPTLPTSTYPKFVLTPYVCVWTHCSQTPHEPVCPVCAPSSACITSYSGCHSDVMLACTYDGRPDLLWPCTGGPILSASGSRDGPSYTGGTFTRLPEYALTQVSTSAHLGQNFFIVASVSSRVTIILWW